MPEDIHHRVTELEGKVNTHLAEHSRFEESLTENTELTKQLVTNTQEIIAIIKGVKGFRTFMVWLTPFVVTLGAIIAWFRGH